MRPQVHRRKIIHIAALKRGLFIMKACWGHQRSVCYEMPLHAQRNTKLCEQGPVKSNRLKGFAIRVVLLFFPSPPSFLNRDVPRDNRMYIFYLPNTDELEHHAKDGRAD